MLPIKITHKSIPITALLIFSLLVISTNCFATTQFFITTYDSGDRIHCNYLELNDRKAICKDGGINITYDLEAISELEAVYKSKSYTVQNFTPERVDKINLLNSKKIEGEKTVAAKRQEEANPSIFDLDLPQNFSLEEFSGFQNSAKNRLGQHLDESKLTTVLIISGLILFLAGSTWYLIEAFRVSLLWGLGNIFVPFVSIIFLFAHWRKAAKPFLLSILGIAVMCSSLFLSPTRTKAIHVAKSKPVAVTKNAKSVENYTCKGKTYCSEMTSCSEAKFYLNNCPGTKLDGNNDGVPCEKQWCR